MSPKRLPEELLGAFWIKKCFENCIFLKLAEENKVYENPCFTFVKPKIFEVGPVRKVIHFVKNLQFLEDFYNFGIFLRNFSEFLHELCIFA